MPTIGSPWLVETTIWASSGNGSQDRDPQNVRHILNGHHIAPPHHIHADPVDDEIGLSDLAGLQKTDDPVGITDGRNLRRSDHKGPVGSRNGIFKALARSLPDSPEE